MASSEIQRLIFGNFFHQDLKNRALITAGHPFPGKNFRAFSYEPAKATAFSYEMSQLLGRTSKSTVNYTWPSSPPLFVVSPHTYS